MKSRRNKSRFRGKWLSPGADRSVVLDLLWLARNHPMFPVERWIDVSALADTRRDLPGRISWTVIFLRAYGLVCRRFPEFRRSYGGVIRPRMFESESVVLQMAISRTVDGCERLFFARFLHPDEKELAQLQSELDVYLHGDVNRVFRQQVQYARMPWWYRRPILWWRYRVALNKRAYRFGNGGISVLAREGVLNRGHPSPLTSSLNYGPIDDRGRMWVTLQCDHQVMDGLLAAEALNTMAHLLNTVVLDELKSMHQMSSHHAA